MSRRLTRAEIILLHGVLSLYRDDLRMIELGPEEAEELEFCEFLILKLETMRDESPGLGGNVDFADALRAMKTGKKVRRALWADGTVLAGTLEIAEIALNGVPRPQLVCRKPDGNWFTFAGSQWDILSDDWEIVSDA